MTILTPEERAAREAAEHIVVSSGPRRRLSAIRVVGLLVAMSLLGTGVAFAFEAGNAPAKAADSVGTLAPYVDVTSTPLYAFESPSNPAMRTPVLGFVVSDHSSPCEPTWGSYYSLDQAKSSLDLDRRIARLRQQGGDVIVSFGGAANKALNVGCTDVTKLTAAYQQVIDRYQLNAIDLDIEGAEANSAQAQARLAIAVAKLQATAVANKKKLAVWLTLPVNPTGLSDTGLAAVRSLLAAKVKVAGVNVMTMDFGATKQAGETMAETSIEALEATHTQLIDAYKGAAVTLSAAEAWAELGATPMIGQNDVATERFTTADATRLAQFAAEVQLGRLSYWSLNRDADCGSNYVSVTTVSNNCSGVDQSDGQFGQIFASAGDQAALSSSTNVSPTSTIPPTTGTEQYPGLGDRDVLADDPATSPYAIWRSAVAYPKDTKIVWHHNVYEAKWWTQGDTPDAPVSAASATPWQLLGPVLPGEHPSAIATVPAGTYPAWTATKAYSKGDKVLYQGIGYVAKWWTTDDVPGADVVAASDTPWQMLNADGSASTANGSPPPTAPSATVSPAGSTSSASTTSR